jgi:hypothetical protein
MPKLCNYENCRFPVFGGGYCRSHQSSRRDGKAPKGIKKAPTRIRSVSTKQQRRNTQYSSVREVFLKNNPLCQANLPDCTKIATDVHHKEGRIGDKLLDIGTYLAVCRGCHQKIEEDPKMAKENNFSNSRLKK